jgi:hypothetical protein
MAAIGCMPPAVIAAVHQSGISPTEFVSGLLQSALSEFPTPAVSPERLAAALSFQCGAAVDDLASSPYFDQLVSAVSLSMSPDFIPNGAGLGELG